MRIFKEAFREAVNYLKKNGCDYALARLEQSDKTFYITELQAPDAESVARTRYARATKTIYWSPKWGAIYKNNVPASPASILNHEAAHAARHARYLKEAEEASHKSMARCL